MEVDAETQTAEFANFELESGSVLASARCAFRTWGTLDAERSNVVVLCHAMTGSADVSDWWGPLVGPGKAFDPERFFVFCANVLGSPYGTTSPVSEDPQTGKRYGPTFPVATVRDDVRLHRRVLDSLGVKTVQFAIGGSMGGMQVLEWAFFGKDYVRNIVPIATSGRHSAWCISWSEAQRQTIYSDPNYAGGYYYLGENAPNAGLAAARMQALLTYRSRNSFETRFGRSVMAIPQSSPQSSPAELHHNEGIPEDRATTVSHASSVMTGNKEENGTDSGVDPSDKVVSTPATHVKEETSEQPRTIYSAQSYLRYQGEKFIQRFDANCYITITRKMDTHDVARERGGDAKYHDVLGSISQPTLVIGIESDGLFTIHEQEELAKYIPNARLEIIHSHEGHDGFLIEFVQMNQLIKDFIMKQAPEYYRGDTQKSVAGGQSQETGSIQQQVESDRSQTDIDPTKDLLDW